MMKRRIKPESGFSLIELLTVLLVVSVLTAIAVMITDGTQLG